MKNSMLKSTLREIKQSFGRWFAILAIIALGVGFFTGLKVCKPAFMETGNTYLAEHNFFDYRLISTLGLEDEDVEIIKDVYQVGNAEGSYSTDALVTLKGSDRGDIGLKVLTISKEINTPSLTAGTMPAKSNECLADDSYFTKDDIGKKIRINKSNKDTTLDMLKHDTYTITGLANSPLYLNYERGSTSIGDGTLSAFIMLPASGFSSDVYTEIYVTLAEKSYIFSDRYDELCKEAKEPLEEALKVCSQRRYDSIIGTAKNQIEEGHAEIDKQKAELAAAEKEVQTNEKYLKGSQSVLNQGLGYYNSGLVQYKTQQEALINQLDKYYEMGLISEDAYKEQRALLEQQLKENEEAINSMQQGINAGKQELNSGLRELNAAKTQIAAGKAQIEEAEKKLQDAQKEIEKIEHPTNYVLDRATNIGYACFDNDISIVDGIAKVFPIFFFLVAALVCMTTMSRMIEEQRTQIGVLKALGYDRNTIIGKYIFYSGSAALIGGISGFFIGTYLFSWVIWEAYKMMYGFADIIFVIDWAMGGIALLAAILCSVGTTIYSCYHELSQVPAQLIRPKSPPAGKRILLERITFLWNRLKFLQKVSIRNAFRYKKRFFMMILGICGCTALLVAAFGINDSIKNVVTMQYDEIYHVDYSVNFNHGLSEEEIAAFKEETKDYTKDYLFLYTGSVDAKKDGEIKTINLVVKNDSQPIDKFVDLHNGKEKLDYPGKGEGIINDNLAALLGLKVGDSFTVYNDKMEKMTVKISGLCDNYVYNYLYITDETYKDAYGEPEINSAYLLGKDDQQPHEVGAKIMEVSNVSSVTVSEDFKSRIGNIMKSMDYIIILVIFCAGALAFIVLYNLTNINITERIREIATIKVLGFYPRETCSYVLRENLILTVISGLVGLPLGKALHVFIMTQIKVDLMNFDVRVAPLSYVYALIFTFIFAMTVNLVMRKKLDKVSMTESLKSVE